MVNPNPLDSPPPPISAQVREEDVRAALACTRPTVAQFGQKYKDWEVEFGSI